MTPRDLIGEAIRSLFAHRLRAALASIGVIAGVATIVASLAIAAGARRQAMAEIGALGIDNILIRASTERDARGRGVAPALTLGDMASLSQRLPGTVVAALRSVHDEVVAADHRVTARVAGVTDEWRATAGLTLAQGRWFGSRDRDARVAVAGAVLARRLFGDNAIGERIFAAGEWRTVIGVLAGGTDPRSARAATDAVDTDRTLFVPLRSLDVTLGSGDGGDSVERIVVRVPPDADVVRAAATSAALVRTRHGADAFETIVPRELLRARIRAQRTSQITLLAFGALALILSGVGIATIMVASVAERAPEIGVRRAFGARRTSIVMQFAVEAAVLSVAGGAAGVIVGVIGTMGFAAIASRPADVSVFAVTIALVSAVAVGLAAGLYPARLAASVSPIDALRM